MIEHWTKLKKDLLDESQQGGVYVGLRRQAFLVVSEIETAPLDTEADVNAAIISLAEKFPFCFVVVSSMGYRYLANSTSYGQLVNHPGGEILANEEYEFMCSHGEESDFFRIRAFDYFFNGMSGLIEGLSSIKGVKEEFSYLYYDLAVPLVFDQDGKVSYYMHLVSPMNSLSMANAFAVADVTTLTKAQMRVLELLIEGIQVKRIAEDLKIAERTIEKHLSQIFHRFQVANVSALLTRLRRV